jgi:hypothetical protein
MPSNKQTRRSLAELSQQYTRWGLNPVLGFAFRSPAQVWLILVGAPVLTVSGAVTAFVVGSTVWPLALLISAALATLSAWLIGASFAWLNVRGWGAAIMEIEHKRRKADAYGKGETDLD